LGGSYIFSVFFDLVFREGLEVLGNRVRHITRKLPISKTPPWKGGTRISISFSNRGFFDRVRSSDVRRRCSAARSARFAFLSALSFLFASSITFSSSATLANRSSSSLFSLSNFDATDRFATSKIFCNSVFANAASFAGGSFSSSGGSHVVFPSAGR
jgi:hypothetical protein